MSNTTKSLRSQRRQQQRRQKQARSIGMIILGLIILVGAAIGLSFASRYAVDLVDPPVRLHPRPDFNALGNPNASVVVENYSSFACGYCKNFFDQSEELFIQNYVASGLVYYIYKPFHFDKSRLEAKASHAALCAGEQDAFWDMHDMLFANIATAYSPANLSDMAKYFNLDMNAFEACMDSGKYYDQFIGESEAAVTELQITGTPTFVINGEVAVVGNEGYEALAAAIDAALEAAQSE